MKLITKNVKSIIADEGKHIISVENKKMLEELDGNMLPGFSPVYFKQISVPEDYTEEQMNKEYIEEDIITEEDVNIVSDDK